MRQQTQNAYIAATCLLVAALTAPSDASARTLAQIKHKGAVSLCANPDALPFSSDKADPPGFQIEIARAIAAGLGVKLEVQVDCASYSSESRDLRHPPRQHRRPRRV